MPRVTGFGPPTAAISSTRTSMHWPKSKYGWWIRKRRGGRSHTSLPRARLAYGPGNRRGCLWKEPGSYPGKTAGFQWNRVLIAFSRLSTSFSHALMSSASTPQDVVPVTRRTATAAKPWINYPAPRAGMPPPVRKRACVDQVDMAALTPRCSGARRRQRCFYTLSPGPTTTTLLSYFDLCWDKHGLRETDREQKESGQHLLLTTLRDGAVKDVLPPFCGACTQLLG